MVLRMPAYDYECEVCGVLELMHPINTPAITQCPKCATDGLVRLISRTSFVLRGGGWARDLYGGKQQK